MGREMTGNMTGKLLSDILSLSESTIKNWTKTQRENVKKEQNRKIIEYYLRGWNTQQGIADILGVPRKTIKNERRKNEKTKI